MLLKACAAPRASLRGVRPEIVEVFLFPEFVNQDAVDSLSCGRRCGQQGVLLVRGDWCGGFAESDVAAARPRVDGGFIDDTRSDRIELDVAVAGEQVVVGIDQCGLEASFPQSAGATVAH